MNSLIDVRALLPAIRVPTLVLHRGTDFDVRVEEGRYIAERIPGARFAELPGADHFVGVDPDQVLDVIEPFVAECGAARARGADDRVLVTLVASDVAGDVAGHRGPGATHTPITFLHATVAPGARLHLPWRPDFNALAYVLSGSGRAGSEGRPVGEGDLVVFGPGDHLLLQAADRQSAATPNLEVVVLGGRPIREPIAWYGPFVMNTRAEVIQAVEDYQAGRLGVVPAGALMPHRG